MAEVLDPAAVLARIPHGEPFRFVDEIVALDDDHVRARYRWRADAAFYRGHFPGHPVTPGVLLVECMAQCVLVPFAIRLLANAGRDLTGLRTVLTETRAEFASMVRPGEEVSVSGRRILFRHRKLRAEAEMRGADGRLVCTATLGGLLVPA